MLARARLRYLRRSPQKARLIVDTIRGQAVGEALSRLRFSRKAASREIEKLLKSAIDNAKQKQEGVDVDRLFISQVYVDEGPTQKRIRPRAQGRAFQILKRSCHLTIEVGIRQGKPEAPTG